MDFTKSTQHTLQEEQEQELHSPGQQLQVQGFMMNIDVGKKKP